MCVVYRIFSIDYIDILDFSDTSLIELFNGESYGTPISKSNGFAVGKKWLNVTVKMWKEDIECGMLYKKELYEDRKFTEWWLDKVLHNIKQGIINMN